jgi:hypothetical protein
VVLHEAIPFALDGLDAAGALDLPGVRRVLPAPGGEKLLVLAGQVKTAGVAIVRVMSPMMFSGGSTRRMLASTSKLQGPNSRFSPGTMPQL